MRLLNARTRKLEDFFNKKIPTYAILSHMWGKDELTFGDIPRNKEVPSTKKIDGLCNQASKDRHRYVWIDTLCIDKSSSAELSDSINSMFRWYQRAKVCYVLEDVSQGEEQMFQRSRWFKRGWTLQELLAPYHLTFFDQSWTWIGDVEKDCSHTHLPFVMAVSSTTKIPVNYLNGTSFLSRASVAQKMSWAAGRQTTREEDQAYCLLGIFDINMTMLYGEVHRAFNRLQEEIMRSSDDHTLFAWGYDPIPFRRYSSLKGSPCSATSVFSLNLRTHLQDVVKWCFTNPPSTKQFTINDKQGCLYQSALP